MQKNKMYTKTILISVIFLLIGAGVVSSYSINVSENPQRNQRSLESELVLNINVPQWITPETTSYDGFLETQWSQNPPYNNFCPIDLASGDRSVAGCPAVAMAQILNYHQTIKNTVFNDSDDYYHSYAGNNYWIDNDYEEYDFPSFPDLNNYLDSLVYNYQNQIPLTDDDIAALVFGCGVAAEQVYNPAGSGTFGVNQAYQAYRRFSFNEVELLDEDDPDLYDRIQQNIEDGLPVHIAVVNEEWTVGHNMVVDGYNAEDKYHINFGWGGPYDDWYQIPEGLPFELTVIEGVVVDIIDDNADSNLHGNGVLSWADVEPGSTVTGSFTIENVGDPGSEIDWEISDYPDWGTWTFTPSSGSDLTPENGPLTIEVEVIAPNEEDKSFSGSVKIVDIENSANSCLIHASLATPKTNVIIYQLFQRFFEVHPLLFPILRHIFEL